MFLKHVSPEHASFTKRYPCHQHRVHHPDYIPFRGHFLHLGPSAPSVLHPVRLLHGNGGRLGLGRALAREENENTPAPIRFPSRLGKFVVSTSRFSVWGKFAASLQYFSICVNPNWLNVFLSSQFYWRVGMSRSHHFNVFSIVFLLTRPFFSLVSF